MIKPLPYWVVPDSFPAFYETEGATAIQMVAKLYGKVQEMIEDYNHFVDQINAAIQEFETSTNQTIEDFKNCITQIMNDYIETIDTKINLQDDKIQDAIDYMKNNIVATTNEIFNQALQNGDITASLNVEYDSTTEELTFSIVAEGGDNNE